MDKFKQHFTDSRNIKMILGVSALVLTIAAIFTFSYIVNQDSELASTTDVSAAKKKKDTRKLNVSSSVVGTEAYDDRFGVGGTTETSIKLGLPNAYAWGASLGAVESLKENGIDTFVMVGHVPAEHPTHTYYRNGRPRDLSFSEIGRIAKKYKGMYWAIGNEPDIGVYISPFEYATYYKKYSDEILKYDKTAKISIGGLGFTKFNYDGFASNNKSVDFKSAYLEDGTYFNYANGKLGNSSGTKISDVHWLREGPCMLQPEDNCRIGTREIYYRDGVQIESITSNGKFWLFSLGNLWGGGTWEGIPLKSVARFVNGPCRGESLDTCEFDTRVIYTVNGKVYESITNNGRIWIFEGDNLASGSIWEGIKIDSFNHYKSGPCVNNSECKFAAREVFNVGNYVYEIVIVGNKYWKYKYNPSDLTKPLSIEAGNNKAILPGLPCKDKCNVTNLNIHTFVGDYRFKRMTAHMDFNSIKNAFPQDKIQIFKNNAYFHLFREYYKKLYKSYPPMHWINIHDYAYQTNYGNGGTNTQTALEESKQQIKSLKEYLKYAKLDSKPIWITEFSLLGEKCGPEADPSNLLEQSLYFDDCNNKAQTLPYDQMTYMRETVKFYKQENIAKWFWYIAGEERYWWTYNSSHNIMFNDRTGELNELGKLYRSLAVKPEI